MPDPTVAASPDAGFARADLTSFCRLDELGLEVTGQRLELQAGVQDAERPQAWRDAVEVVAMDGFTGFKTAAAEELPDAVAVMDPAHVVRLAGDALEQCRRRVQQIIHGHRGYKNDPLYAARRTLHTGADLLTDKQARRLRDLFDVEIHGDAHVAIEATWGIYQRMIAAYRHPDRQAGRDRMVKLIDSINHGVPVGLNELVTLGPTLKRRADDVVAYIDRPGTSNGPTEGDQRQIRTPPRISPRLPQPHLVVVGEIARVLGIG